ncbi:MAG: glycosyltransferase [Pseudomonadota bacterium]
MRAAQHQIIGVCRLSYPSLGSFAGPKHAPDELPRMLFAPQRRNRRFGPFGKLTLSLFAAQSDSDFRLVVLIGTAMQMRFKNWLRKPAGRYPVLRISQQDPNVPHVSTRKAFRGGLEEGAAVLTGFRAADDAVLKDDISQTRNVAKTCTNQGWVDADKPVCIATHRCIHWDMDGPDRSIRRAAEALDTEAVGATLADRFGIEAAVALGLTDAPE